MRTRFNVPVASSKDSQEKLAKCFVTFKPAQYRVRVFNKWKTCKPSDALAFSKAGFTIEKF